MVGAPSRVSAFTISQNFIRVTFPERFTKKFTKKFTEEFINNINLNNSQKQILALIAGNPHLTQEQLADAVGITKRAIAKNMNALKSYGLIERVGANNNGHWKIV